MAKEFSIRVKETDQYVSGVVEYSVLITVDGQAWTRATENHETSKDDLETLFYHLHDILGKDLHG